MGHTDQVYTPSFYRNPGGRRVELSLRHGAGEGTSTQVEASAGGQRGAGAGSAPQWLLLPRAQEEGHLLRRRRLWWRFGAASWELEVDADTGQLGSAELCWGRGQSQGCRPGSV